MTKFAATVAADETFKTQGEITSHAPSTTLIHSSQGRKADRTTVSVMMSRMPTRKAFCVAGMSPSANCNTHGEAQSQTPSAKSSPSPQCMGKEKCRRLVDAL